MRRFGSNRPEDGDQIERYLASLERWSSRRERAELVVEARRHLFDASRRAMGAGTPRDAAVRAALRAFGPAWRVGLRSRVAVASDALASRLGSRAGAARLGRRMAWLVRLRPKLTRRLRRTLERRA